MIEVAILTGLAADLASRRGLREVVAALRPGHRSFLAVLFGLLVAGQLHDDGARTFPFVPWDMYTTRAAGDPVFYEVRVRLASGRLSRLSAFGGSYAVSTQMHQHLQRLAHEVASGPPARARVAFDSALRAIVARPATGSDPPVAVEVTRVTVPLAGAGPASLRREPFRRVELGAASGATGAPG